MSSLFVAAAIAVPAVVALPSAAAPGDPPPADARWPDPDPDVRVGTPNDPDFDCAEPDDEDSVSGCTQVFDEQWQFFGFAPASTRATATYRDPGRFGQGQISGVRTDAAWKTTIGQPEIAVAVTDSGIFWDRESLRNQVFLNTAELPLPEGATSHDANGDGFRSVDDYDGDSRVTDTNGNGFIDAQDLIRAFSDGTDADLNGYVDDIAGWDFLDDDNDPGDVSSYSASVGHGTGRMREAADGTNDGKGEAGHCPRCRVVPLRVWDTFVVPGDNWALATVYTADIGAKVQVVANGVLQNTRAMQEANRYAYDKGVALMHVSSDLNTANHNFPTNYVESVFINGCVADVDGLEVDAEELGDFLADTFGIPTPQPVGTWFRQGNLTQHGAHAHTCFMGATGSQATGQAGGAAGLIHSRGLELADQIGGPLTSGEVKQLLTLNAEDVLPENTVGVGIPDPAQEGWDEHFGYGRANVAAAVEAVGPGTIPPEVLIEDPVWWYLIDPLATPSQPIVATIATRSTGYDWVLEWAPGVEPPNDGFTQIATGSGSGRSTSTLASLPMTDIAAALPGSTDGTPPSDPNAYVFTVRLRVTDADDNLGEDRRTYFAHHDPTAHEGWPKYVGAGGETSPVLYDLDGDGDLEIIEGNSAGEYWVWQHDGTPLPSFNLGRPWVLPPPWNHHPGAPGFATGAVTPVTGGGHSPVVGDLDGDLLPEIVAASTDGRVYLLDHTGRVERGFPVGVDPSLSEPEDRDFDNHPKRGIMRAPSAADLDGDGDVEIIAAALDGHLYAWSTDGVLQPNFPIRIADPDVDTFFGGELIATPTVGDVDGDGDLEIIVISNEVYDAQGNPPSSPGELQGSFQGLVTNLAANALGGTGRVYAVHHDGTYVDGWPVAMNGILPDVLPLVGPGGAAAAGDVDGDGDDEVVANITTGDVHVIDGDGTILQVLPSSAQPGNNTDPSKTLNLFEYPALGDLDGSGGLDVTKGGLGLNALVNLAAPGQNLPANHLVQAWDAGTGFQLPGYPTEVEDYMLLSTPTVVDVDADGTNDIVVGTGLYLLHAFGPNGQEKAGFPKLTGGWTFPVPASGDVDGDGLLEIVVGTREGWRFVWDIDAAATHEGLNQWWGEAHDEWHTNRYGSDTRPPTRIQDLTLDAGGGGQTLTFTATGDDWNLGTATAYEVRYRTDGRDPGSGDGWATATPLAVASAPGAPGTSESVAVSELPDDATGLAVVVVDDVGNRSQAAVLALQAVAPPPAPAPELPATGGGLALLASLTMLGHTLLRRRG